MCTVYIGQGFSKIFYVSCKKKESFGFLEFWKQNCSLWCTGNTYQLVNNDRLIKFRKFNNELIFGLDKILRKWIFNINILPHPRAAVVHLNFRAGSTFPVPVYTVSNSMDRTSRCNKVDAVRLYASYRLN